MVLWVLSALFVLYATTIPFNFAFNQAVILDHLSRITLNPFVSPDTGSRLSGPDFVVNVFFFVPFGALGVGTLRRPRSAVGRIVVVVLCGAALSTTVEILQLFTTNRVSSVGDIFANSFGAFIGAMAWAVLGRGADALLQEMSEAGLTSVPSFYPLMVAAIVVCIAAWEPFDASLDVGNTLAKLRAFRLDPWQFTAITDEGVALLQYALFAIVAATWLRQLGMRAAGTVAFLVAAALGIGLEASQLFIDDRMPGLEDALVHVMGAMTGAIVFGVFPRRVRPIFVWLAVFVATGVAAALQDLSPFKLADQYRPIQWVPFLNYYLMTTTVTISHAIEMLLMYFPVGFGLPLVVRARWRAEMLAMAAVFTIAAPLEYMQGWIDGRYPDVTDVALSILGAWFGVWVGREGWRRFLAYDRQSTDARPAPRARAAL